MNQVFRKVVAAGLGSLALTEKAVRSLIDDLVSKGDLTNREGERILADLERKWSEGSSQLGARLEKGRGELEKTIDSAVTRTLDRLGLVRKSEMASVERRVRNLERKGSKAKAGTTRKAAPKA